MGYDTEESLGRMRTFLGYEPEDELNHSLYFLEAIREMPICGEYNGRFRKISTYNPQRIFSYMEDRAEEEDEALEHPFCSDESYKEFMSKFFSYTVKNNLSDLNHFSGSSGGTGSRWKKFTGDISEKDIYGIVWKLSQESTDQA